MPSECSVQFYLKEHEMTTMRIIETQNCFITHVNMLLKIIGSNGFKIRSVTAIYDNHIIKIIAQK